ncbi:MAG: hypothetical protein AABZ74_15330 [Cyanobacteriota bacterium]
MNTIGTIKADNINIKVIPNNKLSIIDTEKNTPEKKIKTFSSDTVNTNLPASSKNEIKNISLSDEPKKGKIELYKSVEEGVKIKGTLFGLQYMAAGAAVGLGYQSKLLNVVPNIAKNAPNLLKVSAKYPKVAIIALSAGAVGFGIGSLKGSVDGIIINYAPSKNVAMIACAATSALVSIPALKISKTVGVASIAVGAGFGLVYGSHIYDKVKKH